MGQADDREGQENSDWGSRQDPDSAGDRARPEFRGRSGRVARAAERRARAAHIEKVLGLEHLDEKGRERMRAKLHHANQRALLMEALEIQMDRKPEGRLLGAPLRPPLPLGRWRRECGLEIEEAMAGGFRVAGELLACVVQDLDDWPSTACLAAELEDLDAGILTQWMLLRVHSIAGNSAGVQAAAARIDATLLPGPYRASYEECMGVAAEREGEWQRAAIAFESAMLAGGPGRILFAGALTGLELGNERLFCAWRAKLRESNQSSQVLMSACSQLARKRVLIGRPIDRAHLARLRDCCADRERRGRHSRPVLDSLASPDPTQTNRAGRVAGEVPPTEPFGASGGGPRGGDPRRGSAGSGNTGGGSTGGNSTGGRHAKGANEEGGETRGRETRGEK